MLADGIELPIVAAYGLAIFGPLTLLVTAIECFTFKLLLGVGFRTVFKRVLVANIVSALTGGIVFGLQDLFIYSTGITASIPAFVHGYGWVSLLLVVIYYAKSVVVEGLIVATRRFAAKVGRSRWHLAKAVIIGNVASYCVVGPLFVFTTRPTFGHVEVAETTRWAANPDQAVYFISENDQFIKRVNVSGNGLATVVPYAAADFLVSADGSAFAYRGIDGNLYAYREGDAAPILVRTTREHFLMHSVSLSPDKQRVAFVAGCDPDKKGYETEYQLSIFDIASRETSLVSSLHSAAFDLHMISWARDGTVIYAQVDSDSVSVFRGVPPYELVKSMSAEAVSLNDLVENHVRSSRGWYGGRDDWGCPLNDDSKGTLEVQCGRGLGAHILVKQGNKTILHLANDYGLLKLGLPGPHSPSFLPGGSEVLVEWWGQLYLLDFERPRLGLLADGRHYILPSDRFRVRFK